MKRDELTADIAESINMKGSSCNLTNVKRFALLIGSNRASSSVADIITNRCTSMNSLAVLFAKIEQKKIVDAHFPPHDENFSGSNYANLITIDRVRVDVRGTRFNGSQSYI